MKLAERLNGNFWKWTTSVAMMGFMFVLGMLVNQVFADVPAEQQVWNGRVEERLQVVEGHMVMLDEMRDSLIRIETQLGIERGGIQCPSPD